ncbi:hypothetical protein V1477_019896 [Vespula maculifrons]|uniref:Uncharacterized protein n=1 Tax=Vespula maculifrons TaxID=7453 RepID=A0ABD2AKD7_VESMC
MTILRREIFNTSFISELKVKDNDLSRQLLGYLVPGIIQCRARFLSITYTVGRRRGRRAWAEMNVADPSSIISVGVYLESIGSTSSETVDRSAAGCQRTPRREEAFSCIAEKELDRYDEAKAIPNFFDGDDSFGNTTIRSSSISSQLRKS